MSLQPYKVTVINKTVQELSLIPEEVLRKHFANISGLFTPTFSIDELSDIVFAEPEDFAKIINSFKSIDIQVKYSIKQAREFIVQNESKIIEDGNVEFVCTMVKYMTDNCDQDEIYSRILDGKEVTPADKYILENS